MKASPAAVPSTASTCGGSARAISSPVLEQHRALGAERQRDEAVAALQHLELVAVDDRQVGVDVDRPRAGAAFRQKSPVACSQALITASSGHLELAVRTASARGELDGARASAFAPGATAIWFSPSASTRISATPVGASTRGPRSTPAAPPRGSASSAKGSSPTAQTSVTSAPSRAHATAWFAPLPPRNALEDRVRDRLPRPRQPLDLRDEVEVDATRRR